VHLSYCVCARLSCLARAARSCCLLTVHCCLPPDVNMPFVLTAEDVELELGSVELDNAAELDNAEGERTYRICHVREHPSHA
jgi:hypothetical protein